MLDGLGLVVESLRLRLGKVRSVSPKHSYEP